MRKRFRRRDALKIGSILGSAAIANGCASASPWTRLPPKDTRKRWSETAITWWGTASVFIELGGIRLLTDPAFDAKGSEYDFGLSFTPRAWFASEKTYEVELSRVPTPIHAALVSHDHHADNLDYRGRELLQKGDVSRVITTEIGAQRMANETDRDVRGRSPPGTGLAIGSKLTGLRWGESTLVEHAGEQITITATPGLHGPAIVPDAKDVCGFLIEGKNSPTIWISGDTVAFEPLHEFFQAWSKKIDIAIVHCGGVRFPDVPLIGGELFTYDANAVVKMVEVLQPATIIPVHHSGWTHFREPLQNLRSTLDASPFADRLRWLELGRRETFEHRV